MQRWLAMSASALGRGIEAGQIDPVALTETYLDAIAAHPFADRIYVRLTPDRARAEAHAASNRAKAGKRLSPLDGVPISWKDLFDTAGIVTEAGSMLLEGRVPDVDADVLAKATALGLVCLGKTHMSELAFSGLGYNPITETPPCVNDHAAVSGGSSSGAAASVAFGLAPAAIGSDTGGSVRIPAAWNDLVGLKTTSERVSLDGVVPLCLKFDTVGPLCRSVEDCANLLAAMEGTAPIEFDGPSVEGRKFLILETTAFDDLRPEPWAAFNSAITRLQDAGAIIERKEIPEVAQAMPLSALLYSPEAYMQWKDVIEAAPEKMYSEILERFRSGAAVSQEDYDAAWETLYGLRKIFQEKTAEYNGVLIPSSPTLPPNMERIGTDHDYYVRENLLALRNTRIGNLMGSCALTIPTGVPSCGIMVMGQPFQEEALLQAGAAVELALA